MGLKTPIMDLLKYLNIWILSFSGSLNHREWSDTNPVLLSFFIFSFPCSTCQRTATVPVCVCSVVKKTQRPLSCYQPGGFSVCPAVYPFMIPLMSYPRLWLFLWCKGHYMEVSLSLCFFARLSFCLSVTCANSELKSTYNRSSSWLQQMDQQYVWVLVWHVGKQFLFEYFYQHCHKNIKNLICLFFWEKNKNFIFLLPLGLPSADHPLLFHPLLPSIITQIS